jgi:hypothetical protein
LNFRCLGAAAPQKSKIQNECHRMGVGVGRGVVKKGGGFAPPPCWTGLEADWARLHGKN